MSREKSIRIFLADGDVTGVRHGGIVNLTVKTIMVARMHLPDLNENGEVVRRMCQFSVSADLCKQRFKEAQSSVKHLTHSILAKTFRGELVTEWRERYPRLLSGKNTEKSLLVWIKGVQKAVSSTNRSIRNAG